MMLQILTSLKTWGVPENLKLQKHFNHKLKFEWVREKNIKATTLANHFLSAISCRKIKTHCAEPFTDYWTCIDYTNLQELRRCRKQQAVFDNCVLEKLGWVRPDLGQLSKVTSYLFWSDSQILLSLLRGILSRPGLKPFSRPEGDSWTWHWKLVDFTGSQDSVSVLPRRLALFLDNATYSDFFAFPSAETSPLGVKLTHM